MGNRYVKSEENKKILYVDANNLYGHSMSGPWSFDEIKIDKNVKIEDFLNTPDASDIEYFIAVDLTYPDNKKKQNIFHSLLKKINLDNFTTIMNKNKNKSSTHTQTKKLICDWIDKNNYLIHYRITKIYIRHGMVVDKVHEIISFRQSKWLEKNTSFNAQKRNQAVNDFEKDFYELLINSFYGKTMEIVRIE